MQELTFEQVEDVSGGFLPAIVVGLNAANYAVNAYRAYKTVRVVTQTTAAAGVGGLIDGLTE